MPTKKRSSGELLLPSGCVSGEREKGGEAEGFIGGLRDGGGRVSEWGRRDRRLGGHHACAGLLLGEEDDPDMWATPIGVWWGGNGVMLQGRGKLGRGLPFGLGRKVAPRPLTSFFCSFLFLFSFLL
jgi:hypothetical protein